MGKAKATAPKKGAAPSAPPRCNCSDLYKCECGNRPERPSRGHKWDPESQQWGGKGHKQKGGGQAAQVGVEAKKTEVGKTTIAQWQKLPSQLLDDVTKREGRPQAKFEQIDTYKFRVIIQDAKIARRGGDHDIILMPANTVANPEQAKEEAALLGLLHLTPSLPHERTLPEPYKTTWIHAVQAAKDQKKADAKSATSKPTVESAGPSVSTSADGNAAKASTNLVLATSFVSKAEKRKQDQEKVQERNALQRKYDAIRNANRDHQVFMSAKIRKLIENLLRGDTVQWEEIDDQEVSEGADKDLKTYVIQRLCTEGFTKSQALTSFGKLQSVNDKEELWESIYDECLQWLCIHLDEDQLPEGFDPRGRTLDIVAAPSSKSQTNGPPNTNPEVQALAIRFGLTHVDASFILKKKVASVDETIWDTFYKAANTPFIKETSPLNVDKNGEIVNDELQVLESIYPPEDCYVETTNGFTTVRIKLPEDDHKLTLEIMFHETKYPSIHPSRILIIGDWVKCVGAAVHIELVKFVSSLRVGDPMIFEIVGHLQNLLQSAADGELSFVALSSEISSRPTKMVADNVKGDENSEFLDPKPVERFRRPRERSSFWSRSPKQTPAATAFPNIGAAMKAARESLPAAKARAEFISVMRAADKCGRVVLVTGDTGCGKTTQIPQFILEAMPADAKIVVAQPRRLAATGVSTRVASERGESKAGIDSVGYVVRGDVAMSEKTRLLFCTTGVLLRQLQSEGALDCITHILVDEVHERHLDTDVLLGVLKESLKTTPHLRVILMSATLDADRFAAYWGENTPRIHIPGRTFPVDDYFLEDVLNITGYIPPRKGKKKHLGRGYQHRKKSSPWADSEKSDEEREDDDDTMDTESVSTSSFSDAPSHTIPTEDLVKRVDETTVDYDMLGQLVKQLILNNEVGSDGSILVFMSGAPEISNAIETIVKITRGMAVQTLPLHGGLQSKDQNLVFKPAPKGTTKVIVSTNVAETSITIPDCTIVIDACREKQSSYDPVNRMPLLLENFAAKASLKQRRGRAGRVRSGKCYKLISQVTYDKLPDHGTPEIHRCALDQTLLSLMFLGVEKGSGNFLRTLLDPPSQKSMDSAILSLQKLGAISPNRTDGSISLTPLGMHLAGIPAPPTVGKMLVMGSILGCRSAALAMAAGMSVGRSPFLRIDNRSKRNQEEESLEDMIRGKVLEERADLFKSVGNSDHVLLAAAYLKWDSCKQGDRRRCCDQLGLAFSGMNDMQQLVRQLDSSLSTAGYCDSQEADRNSNSWRIIRSCAVAALAPSQVVRVQKPSTKYHETAEGAVEKDGEARELKFFIQAGMSNYDSESSQSQDGAPPVQRHFNPKVAEERVFFHPSSANFSTGNFACPWLVYHELVRTSKPFLRDATESSAYALLLFGGKLEVQASKGLIVIEDWVRLAANARIGALIGGLRKKIDELLQKKVEEPRFDIAGTVEMKLIRSLLVTDGLG